MDEEFLKRLGDYFDAPDLVDMLGISTEDLVEAFRDTIEENEARLKEILQYGD